MMFLLQRQVSFLWHPVLHVHVVSFGSMGDGIPDRTLFEEEGTVGLEDE